MTELFVKLCFEEALAWLGFSRQKAKEGSSVLGEGFKVEYLVLVFG